MNGWLMQRRSHISVNLHLVGRSCIDKHMNIYTCTIHSSRYSCGALIFIFVVDYHQEYITHTYYTKGEYLTHYIY